MGKCEIFVIMETLWVDLTQILDDAVKFTQPGKCLGGEFGTSNIKSSFGTRVQMPTVLSPWQQRLLKLVYIIPHTHKKMYIIGDATRKYIKPHKLVRNFESWESGEFPGFYRGKGNTRNRGGDNFRWGAHSWHTLVITLTWMSD